jgi:hypothetical protein
MLVAGALAVISEDLDHAEERERRPCDAALSLAEQIEIDLAEPREDHRVVKLACRRIAGAGSCRRIVSKAGRRLLLLRRSRRADLDASGRPKVLVHKASFER